MHWLEVALTVNGEAAEAVADVLARFAPQGVVIEATQFETTAGELGRPVGPVVVRAYLPADSAVDATRARLEEALWHLGQLLPLPSPQYQPVSEADWAESWKANFQPIRVGRRLMIIPAWLGLPVQPGDIAVHLDPGMAFGTGTHPTTQLCLAAIERHLAPGAAMLDLGTGSGILAIAAAKLGAGLVVALDTERDAVRVAQENAAANGVADRLRIAQGSLRDFLAGTYGVNCVPLVVANILAPVIVGLLEQGLAQTVTPGGLLVLSGILETQAYEVVAALRAQDLPVIAQEHAEDWVAIIARRPPGN